MGRESILINKSLTDLRAVEQLTDSEQLNGLAALLLDAAERRMDGRKTLVQVVDLLERQMDEKDLLLFSLLEDLGIWRGRDGRRSLNVWIGAGN